MATNQTTNYQLNQWEPADQVLRTDFNADNAKLDAALLALDASKLGNFQTIRSTILEVSSYHIDLDLSGISWSEWAFAGFFFGRDTTLTTSTLPFLLCQLSAGSVAHNFIQIAPAPFFALLLPRHDEASFVEGIYISEKGSAPSFLSCTYEKLTSMSICYSGSQYHFPSGTNFSLWGVQ